MAKIIFLNIILNFIIIPIKTDKCPDNEKDDKEYVKTYYEIVKYQVDCSLHNIKFLANFIKIITSGPE